MKTRNLTDLVHFSDDEARREVLVETERIFGEVVCLQSNQQWGPIADAGSDALVTVLAGEIAAQIGKGRARMRQWEAVVVPAGDDLTMRNASEEPSVVLLVLAPPPAEGS